MHHITHRAAIDGCVYAQRCCRESGPDGAVLTHRLVDRLPVIKANDTWRILFTYRNFKAQENAAQMLVLAQVINTIVHCNRAGSVSEFTEE